MSAFASMSGDRFLAGTAPLPPPCEPGRERKLTQEVSHGDQIHEVLEPRVERRPAALAFDVRAAAFAELVAAREQPRESVGEAGAFVRDAAAGAADLTAGHRV